MKYDRKVPDLRWLNSSLANVVDIALHTVLSRIRQSRIRIQLTIYLLRVQLVLHSVIVFKIIVRRAEVPALSARYS